MKNRIQAPTTADFVTGADVPIDPVRTLEGLPGRGNLGIKALMAGEDMLAMEVHREKGLVDPEHSHDDHESICYLVRGRMRVVIAGAEFIAGPGDIWKHRAGVPHYHEALEDSLQLEFKSPPCKTWN